MSALRELQSAFGAAIGDAGRTAVVTPLFRVAPERVPARFAVYRGNVYGNCANALTGAYPIVRKIVGEEFFEATAREYARVHPSASGDLNEYGEAFATFLGEFPETRELPYLPDVARMEWLAHRAYYAADSARYDPARLANLPPERWTALHPALAPSCALLESIWPLARIWTVHQDDYTGEFHVNLDSGPDRILVHRPRWNAEVVALSAGDYRFLAAASAGISLGDALETAVADDPEFDPAAVLVRWIESGVVVGLEDPQETRT